MACSNEESKEHSCRNEAAGWKPARCRSAATRADMLSTQRRTSSTTLASSLPEPLGLQQCQHISAMRLWYVTHVGAWTAQGWEAQVARSEREGEKCWYGRRWHGREEEAVGEEHVGERSLAERLSLQQLSALRHLVQRSYVVQSQASSTSGRQRDACVPRCGRERVLSSHQGRDSEQEFWHYLEAAATKRHAHAR
jgi:hypothetical protein